MDFKTYHLLDKPTSALGLKSATVDFLSDQAIDTVGDLLDRDWILFPTDIADEIQAAVERAGLRSAADTEAESETTPAQEWDRVVTTESEAHAYRVYRPGESDVDLELLSRDPRWNQMERLWVEYWGQTDFGDDFRPWFDGLIEAPPSSLRSLDFGGYGDRSVLSTLGSVSDLLAALPRLESLGVTGDMDDLSPFSSTTLTSLYLTTAAPPAAGWASVFEKSDLPALKRFELANDDQRGNSEDLVAIFGWTTLKEVELHHFELSAEFIDAAARSGLRLDTLNVTNCGTPFEDPAREKALFDALIRTSDTWADTKLILPEDAIDFADQLASAGLDCYYE